ncbi:MAG TPA: hypothetical protein GX745_01365 [Clostridiales bacterium]|nr:hypothetical protein [Clostridiales bacterium]
MNIFELLRQYAQKSPSRFHTPGHKGLLDAFDITELDLIDYGSTTSYLAAAEKKTARYYNSKYTHYLISGTTSGIITLISALSKGRIIVARASHKSIFNGCLLWGVEPLIIENEIKDDIALPLSPQLIEKALLANPDVKAVFLTAPNYYGINTDLKAIKEIIGDRYLLVDAAHGAHFGAVADLPTNATQYADACVLSAHKTLPAFTQTAYLNVNNEKLESVVKNILSLSATTSPSFLFLAGLEYATEYLIDNAKHYNALKQAIERYLPFRMPNDDFTRIVIDLKPYKINGAQANKFLQRYHNIYCEFGNQRYIVFIISIVDTEETVKKLSFALQDLFEKAQDLPSFDYSQRVPIKPARALSFIDAAMREAEYVELAKSEGRISAVEAGLFPPCLPVIARGEIITREIIEILSSNNTFGLNNDKILVLK